MIENENSLPKYINIRQTGWNYVCLIQVSTSIFCCNKIPKQIKCILLEKKITAKEFWKTPFIIHWILLSLHVQIVPIYLVIARSFLLDFLRE